MEKTETLLQMILRLQPQIQNDASQLCERDLQAAYEALNSDKPVDPAFVGAFRAHIQIAFFHLHELEKNVLNQLIPDGPVGYSIIRQREEIVNTENAMQEELGNAMDGPYKLETRTSILDALEFNMNSFRGYFTALEEHIKEAREKEEVQ